MARYLVVAHQTSASTELLSRMSELAAKEPTEFVLLVPATPIGSLLTWVEGAALEVARRTAQLARTEMEEMGLPVSRTEVGDGSPLVAIADELREHPEPYDAIIVSTLPLGVSKWLKLDLPHQVERKFALPVIHVVGEAKAAEVGSSS